MARPKKNIDTKNSEHVFSKYEYRRASDDIANEIKKTIFEKKFTEGTRLPSEQDLAAQFRVSRMTIREALRLLETKGIITIKKGPKGGVFVQGESTEQIVDIVVDKFQLDGLKTADVTETRIILERGIVKAAILNGTKADLEDIKTKLALFKTTLKDVSSNVEMDSYSQRIAFHESIAEATHNYPLILFHNILKSWAVRLPRWYPNLEERKRIYQSYNRIFKAIQAKDIDTAQSQIEKYIRRSMVFIG